MISVSDATTDGEKKLCEGDFLGPHCKKCRGERRPVEQIAASLEWTESCGQPDDKGSEIEQGCQAGDPLGEVGHSLGLYRVADEEQRGEKGDEIPVACIRSTGIERSSQDEVDQV